MPDDKESTHEQLAAALTKLERERVWWRQLLNGVFFGVGSVIGIAGLVYLLLPFLEQIPIIGALISQVSSGVEETANQRLPTPIRTTPTPAPATPAPTPPPSISGQTTVGTNYFAVELPAGWDIKLNEGNKGVQLSRLEAESDDFASHTDDTADGPFTPTYYDAGASLVVLVTEPAGDSGEHGQVIEEKTITLDGESATYHEFAEPSTASGIQFDVHATHKGNVYHLTFSAAESFPDAKATFDTILANFTFRD